MSTDPASPSAAATQLLEQRVAERTQQLTTLLQISRNVASTLDLESLLGLILDQLKVVIDYSSASINSLEDGMLQALASRSPLPRAQVLKIRYPADGVADRHIIATHQPYLIPDIQDDSPEARLFREEARAGGEQIFGERAQEVFDTLYGQTRTWVRLPLLVKNEVIGMLTLHHWERNYYSPQAIDLALAFAHQAAVAIQNARLFAAEQRRAEQFRVIAELGHRITAILPVDELLKQAVQLIRETFGYYHIHIGLIEKDEVIFKASAGTWREADECRCCSGLTIRVGQTGISGWVAATGEPYLARDVNGDPRFIQLEPNQTGSELVLPLKVKGVVIGVLDVESERINAFDLNDVTVLQSLANQMATAIDNARLYEQSQQLAALEERQRLARELHDSVSQALYGIALGARTARTLLDRDPSKLAEPLDYVLSLAEAGLAEMRALIFELRPESLETEGLVVALTKQANALRARYRLEVDTDFCDEPAVPVAVKEALYRIAQESLHNIVKHAQAKRVSVCLEKKDESLRLEIRDDGLGFDLSGDFPGHLGLRSMRERAARIGGVLEVESAPLQGTSVRVNLKHVSAHPSPI